MPKDTTRAEDAPPVSGLKGEMPGPNRTLRASTLAAMPHPVEREKSEHPHVTINGRVYEWEPGEEAGIPEEALTIWQRALEANA